MLPPPKNSKFGNKELNRPLIPHVVSKAKAAESSAQIINKYLKVDSVPEEHNAGPADFFSLSEESEEKLPAMPTKETSSNNPFLQPTPSTQNEYHTADNNNSNQVNEGIGTNEKLHPIIEEAEQCGSGYDTSSASVLGEQAGNAAEDPYQDEEVRIISCIRH